MLISTSSVSTLQFTELGEIWPFGGKKKDEHSCIRNTYAHQLLAILLLLKQPILLYQKLVPWSRLSMQLDQNMGDGGTAVAWDL